MRNYSKGHRGYVENDNRDYKKNFDKYFYEHFNQKSEEERFSKLYRKCQWVLLILTIVCVLIGTVILVASDADSIPKSVIVFYSIGGVSYLAGAGIMLGHRNRKGYKEDKMESIREAFCDIYDGYLGFSLQKQLAIIEKFSLEYVESFSVIFDRVTWKVTGIAFKLISILLGLIFGYLDVANMTTFKLLVWLLIIWAVDSVTNRVSSEKSFASGCYKPVTVEYREWLLKKYDPNAMEK